MVVVDGIGGGGGSFHCVVEVVVVIVLVVEYCRGMRYPQRVTGKGTGGLGMGWNASTQYPWLVPIGTRVLAFVFCTL